MVDALIEATARILVREGFDKASTNRIAEVAGVSVGSLYQYYPSKEALVAAVILRHNQEIMRLVRGALAEVASQPLAKAMRRLVTVAVEAHRDRRPLFPGERHINHSGASCRGIVDLRLDFSAALPATNG